MSQSVKAELFLEGLLLDITAEFDGVEFDDVRIMHNGTFIDYLQELNESHEVAIMAALTEAVL